MGRGFHERQWQPSSAKNADAIQGKKGAAFAVQGVYLQVSQKLCSRCISLGIMQTIPFFNHITINMVGAWFIEFIPASSYFTMITSDQNFLWCSYLQRIIFWRRLFSCKRWWLAVWSAVRPKILGHVELESWSKALSYDVCFFRVAPSIIFRFLWIPGIHCKQLKKNENPKMDEFITGLKREIFWQGNSSNFTNDLKET